MRETVIVGAARTPVGRARGGLASVPAHVLGGLAAKAALERSGVNPADVEEVIFGNLFANEYANFARVVSLEAGLPYEVPAFTIDRQCASSLSALQIGAAMIAAGQADIVLVGGAESDSRRSYVCEKPSQPYQITPPQWVTVSAAPSKEDSISMVETAENVAREFGITREACDLFAVNSHKKAAAAWSAGVFDSQIVPVEVPLGKGKVAVFDKDEIVRPDTTFEVLSKLRPVLGAGVVTAGNASPMSDGAGALVLVEKEKAKALGLKIWAKFVAGASAGLDPKIMGYGPVKATKKLLAKDGRTLADIDLIEMNEAFATQSLACIAGLEIDQDKLNVNGGAIALGHPLAGTGAILVTKMVYELERRNLSSGLITFCVGGGQGVSAIIERE
ncbi:MAG: thiolase family protein [Clostridiales bacterium]|nr:thiolase family protein [Clostridiales bacterium]